MAPLPALFLLQPPSLVSGIDEFHVKIIPCQKKSDIPVPEGFARLRRHDETRAFLLQERDLNLYVITSETKVVKSATLASKRSHGRIGPVGSINFMISESCLNRNTTLTRCREFDTISEFFL